MGLLTVAPERNVVSGRSADGGSAHAAGEIGQAVHLQAGGERSGGRHARRGPGRANALRRRGELARPLRQFTEALVHYHENDDVVGVQQTLRFIGQVHLDMGHPDAAVATLREAERTARELGRPSVLAPTLYWRGHAFLARGKMAAAEAAFTEVLVMFPDGGVGHAYALHGLGALAPAGGELEVAAARLARAGECAREGADVAREGRICPTAAALEGPGTRGSSEKWRCCARPSCSSRSARPISRSRPRRRWPTRTR